LAVELAGRCGVVLVLKGHATLITDGRQRYVNRTGNPGLSTGGTGDVLTGMIAALIAQGLQPLDAARLGAHLHGRAADLAADEYGEVPMIASDLMEFFPEAFESVA
jgi:NAD(P)H-hydrate epimerase